MAIPDVAFQQLEVRVEHIERDYARAFEALTKREQANVSQVEARLKKLEPKLGKLDESLSALLHVVANGLKELRERHASRVLVVDRELGHIRDKLDRPMVSKRRFEAGIELLKRKNETLAAMFQELSKRMEQLAGVLGADTVSKDGSLIGELEKLDTFHQALKKAVKP